MQKTPSTIIVTGGTKGIGKAIIEKFSSKGFNIITCARNEADLEKLKAVLNASYPNIEVKTYKVDMSDKNEVFEFITQINTDIDSVDILVNNAGVFIPGAIHEEEDGALEMMINTNLMSAYHMSRGIIPGMKATKSGYIFNICSIASFMAYPNGGSYAISKFAMLGMSKGLREELKSDGIRVSSVMPGATYTASWEGVDVPEERLMKAEDIAELIWSAYSLSERTVVEDIVVRPQLGDL